MGKGKNFGRGLGMEKYRRTSDGRQGKNGKLYKLGVIWNTNLKSEPNEKWVVIPNTNGIYEGSSFGRVKTHNWRNWGYTKIVIPSLNRDGYISYVLTINGKTLFKSAHQIVGLFIKKPKSDKKLQLNHKDGNKLRNTIDNLEWCTHLENLKHYHTKLYKSGDFAGSRWTSKLTEDDVRNIRMGKYAEKSNKEIAGIFSCTPDTIKSVRDLKSWKHVK